MDSLSSLKSIKRHYKKDSRYVNDLYTLTYDNHESLEDTVELISSLYFRTDITADVSVARFLYRRFMVQSKMISHWIIIGEPVLKCCNLLFCVHEFQCQCLLHFLCFFSLFTLILEACRKLQVTRGRRSTDSQCKFTTSLYARKRSCYQAF